MKLTKITPAEHERLKRDLASAEEYYSQAIKDKAEAHRISGDPDMHEDAAAEDAYRRFLMWGQEAARLKGVLNQVEIIGEIDSDDTVQIGLKVTLLLDGEEMTLEIGGPHARFSDGQLSNLSPIGASIMGKEVGFSTEVKTEEGMASVRILSIQRPK